MAAPTAEELAAVEARLSRILDPYRARLDAGTIYGIPTLRRRGAKAHDWFAFVKPASKHVSFYLLPIADDTALREGLSPGLRKRLTGKAVFTFSAVDETQIEELEAVVARAYEGYAAAG